MRVRVLVTVDEGSIDEVLTAGCDGAVVDLADAALRPEAARERFLGMLPRLREAGLTVAARVNHPRTGLLRDDLEAIVQEGLAAVILPHVTEPRDVRRLAVILREFELPRGVEPGTVAVFPAIDTARGLLRAAELATAVPRVAGLVFDAAGYAAHVGARDEEWGPRLSYARGLCVAAARAADGLPIVAGDGSECRQLAHYGFAGVLLPDASRVASALAAFTPGRGDVERARAAVAAYRQAKERGELVARLGRTIVDGSDARRARQTLETSSGEAQGP